MRPFAYTEVLSNIEKAQSYWNNFKPDRIASSTYQEKWLALAPLFDQLSVQHSVFITIWDVLSCRFIYMVDKRKVVGYDPSLFTAETGVDFSLANYHPDYLNAILLMQQRAFQVMSEKTQVRCDKIIINFDGFYKRSDGIYIHLLQQAVAVEADMNRKPLLFLSYLYDITHLKKDPSANLIVAAEEELQMWDYNFHKKELEQVKRLTIQEKKVLTLLALGKQSKEIGDELNISPHTVDTHRRNLLKKTNCLDSTALVSYLKMVGLV